MLNVLINFGHTTNSLNVLQSNLNSMKKPSNNPVFFNTQAQEPFQTLALGMLQLQGLKGHFNSGILPFKGSAKTFQSNTRQKDNCEHNRSPGS